MKSDGRLLAAVRRGDERAVRKLVDTYSPRLYNLALRILRNPQDAEDAVQETFITALDKLDQFDGRAELSTWIYRIGVNASLMALRKKRSQRRKEESIEVPEFEDIRSRELMDWNTDPARELLKTEMREVMETAIGKLPPKYRVVFVLRDLEGLSIAETSKALGLSAANVKVRLMRARLFLREALGQYFHESPKPQVQA
ncbi:MAG: sigma-70 family RNA polymerase sigma factor [candidate division KSB1 bacterium]|nr:sigma-70 family RNA polymerase sigma factor [candidate division KSB1 bacterium]MDZ7366698.1 sigma-70 family RNA polymerase sigma factor [candidate division KSB1 bacterium]MDZ7404711.1 sigma-70 family RNA polymerase sigma factor [candidate division KSB1 bacterium]